MGIHAVADDLGADKDDQFGTRRLIVLMREGVAQTLNLVEQGNSVALVVMLFADQSGQQHRLAGGHGNRTLDLSFGDRRSQTRGGSRRNVADFLLDVEPDISVDVDAGRNPQNDTRVAIVDRVDDRVVRRQPRSAAGGDWHDIADLKGCRLIVDHNQGWVGQYLDAGDGVQRV